MGGFADPVADSYDVVIIGGAIMGSATAWFLSDLAPVMGRVLVLERDPSYRACSTSHTNSCMRQQFSTELNVRISQFAAEFVKNLRSFMGGDAEVPDLSIQNFGYMYLAASQEQAEALRTAYDVQAACGAGTRLLSPSQIAAAFPFYALDDILLGSHNTKDEGYWDGITVFDWFRRSARTRGVEYVANEVVALNRSSDGRTVESVTLATGAVVSCGQVVNATGPRAARTAEMAGITLPIEPRKRFTWIFSAERPLDRRLPLTVDPSGLHVRQDGAESYMAGGHSAEDPAVDFDDFEMDPDLWMDQIWPALAARIPQFEAIKVTNEWAGHYAYNVLDQNAVIGPHPEVENFHFINGFSGHGLQQSPAMGRGLAEMLTFGRYVTLDLSVFHYDRIVAREPVTEAAVI